MNSWYNRDQANDAISSFSLSRCTMKYEMICCACRKAKGNFIIRSRRNLVFCRNICVLKASTSKLSLAPSVVVDDLNTREERTRDKTIKIKSILFFMEQSEKRFLCAFQIVSTMISVKTSKADSGAGKVLSSIFLLLLRVFCCFIWLSSWWFWNLIPRNGGTKRWQ